MSKIFKYKNKYYSVAIITPRYPYEIEKENLDIVDLLKNFAKYYKFIYEIEKPVLNKLTKEIRKISMKDFCKEIYGELWLGEVFSGTSEILKCGDIVIVFSFTFDGMDGDIEITIYTLEEYKKEVLFFEEE